jgi:hypothetical protein
LARAHTNPDPFSYDADPNTTLVVYFPTCHATPWNGPVGSFTTNDSDTTTINRKEVKGEAVNIDTIDGNL